MRCLFIIHRLFFSDMPKEGGIDFIIRYLYKKNVTLYKIEHPFDKYNACSTMKENEKKLFSQRPLFKPPIVWVFEILLNIYWCSRVRKKYDWIFVSDPLNFISAYLLKLIGFTRKIHWHSVDYSPRRFDSFFLEWIYQKTYNFSAKKSDRITVVSTRMLTLINKISNNPNVFLLPNSPFYNSVPKQIVKNRYSLVLTVSKLDTQVDIEKLLNVSRLLKKKYNLVEFHLIGYSDNTFADFIKNSDLSSFVTLHGIVPYSQCLNLVSSCGVGIVWYTDEKSYLQFADSLKIWEYAAAGLPIITNDVVATSDEVLESKSGFVITTVEEMYEAIDQLFSDSSLYDQMSRNALAWAQKNDKRVLLDKIFSSNIDN